MARRDKSSSSAAISEEVMSKFKAIMVLTDAFCKRYLNEEYVKMCRRLALALVRKRPTPLPEAGPKSGRVGSSVPSVGRTCWMTPQVSLHETDRHRSQIWRSQ